MPTLPPRSCGHSTQKPNPRRDGTVILPFLRAEIKEENYGKQFTGI
nr:MAG TPA: hypothetical protein [Caudoviricetes sp.]